LGDTCRDTGGRGPIEDDVLGNEVVGVRVRVVGEERGGGGFVAGTAAEGGRGAAGAGGIGRLFGRAGVGHVPGAGRAGGRHPRGVVGGRERGQGNQRSSTADVVCSGLLLAVVVARAVLGCQRAASSAGKSISTRDRRG